MTQKIIILLFVLTTFSCNSQQEYKPIILRENILIEDQKPLTDSHRTNIIKVLKYYNVDWKLKDNKILISSSLNKELIWNYTQKANDEKWLRNHTK